MIEKKYNIVIATGIYPPEIGGPAQYAEMLLNGFRKVGYNANVVTYGQAKKFPTGIRHFIYFLRLLPSVSKCDAVIALDTFSSALPAVLASKLFGKKIIVRVGGDFLWESFLERTHQPILLSDFYKTERGYTRKERMIFKLTKRVFKKADIVVFSTGWQKNIMQGVYKINSAKIRIIENLYENKQKRDSIPVEKVILSPSRNIFLKNKINMQKAVDILKLKYPDIIFDESLSSSQKLEQRIRDCYCLVVPSYSEVSPNIVLQAISFGVPAVVTSDCGIKDRLADAVIWVNPLRAESIADGIGELFDREKYNQQVENISKFSFVRTADDIVGEFLSIINNL